MQRKIHWMTVTTLALMALSGCDKMAGLSNSAEQAASRDFNDSKTAWTDLFTYHPPQAAPLPQTRYCYKMQSDVVCYDSEQPTLTAKLIGYQDGVRQSWIQPGGGSLGASGGAPVSYRGTTTAALAAPTAGSNDYNMSTGPVSGSVGAGAAESHISVNTLPPIAPRMNNN